MENFSESDASDRPWNTEDLAIEGMTCKELARFCTTFISCLRMSRSELREKDTEGVMDLVMSIFKQQQKLLKSKKLTADQMQKVRESSFIIIQAACLAAVFSMTECDPRVLSNICVGTIDTMHEMSKHVGPIGDDDEAVFQMRQGTEGTLQMAARLEPSTALADSLTKGILGQEIKRIVTEEQGPFEFGNN